MGWLLELLIDGIREICSQFVVDMMDLVTGMFTELLSCDLSLFEELFSVVGDLYKNVIVPMGIAILLLICIWQLFKSMFGKSGVSSEEPIELVCRSCIALFFIVAAKPMINYILNVAGTPYQWVVGTDITVESFSEYVSALESVTGVLGIGSLNISILMLIMQLVVAWNYFKMLFIIAERYVLLGVFSYTAPLAFSTGGSKSTNNILASWAKMFGGQIVLIILNAWCMKMFLSGYGNLMASSYGFTKFFVATLCLIGFCKITFKLDSYMASLGVNLGRPSYGLGAMGLMMAAGRILSHTGKGGSGGTEHTTSDGVNAGASANGNMPGTPADPIPMSFDKSDGSMDMENMQQGNNLGEEMDVQSDMESQGEFMPEHMDEDDILDEMGTMPTDIGADTNEDSGIMDQSGSCEDAGISTESEEFPELKSDAALAGERNDLDRGMSESGYGNETNVLSDMSDYPVEEEYDGETEPEMDLDGGSIDTAGIDTDGVTNGSAEPSGNGLYSGGNDSGDAGSDTLSEMGGETAVGGFESQSIETETGNTYGSDGHTFDTKTLDEKSLQNVEQSPNMEADFFDDQKSDYEFNDEGHAMRMHTGQGKPMNNLELNREIPSSKGKIQGTNSKAGKRDFYEVPRSREELRRRKQEDSTTSQKNSKHKN